jgi:hypothetical protein
MQGVISWKRRASRCKNLANRLDKLIFRDGDLGFGAKFQIIRAVGDGLAKTSAERCAAHRRDGREKRSSAG